MEMTEIRKCAKSRVIPAVNQVELTSYCFQKELLDCCRKHNILLQAYSPLPRGQRLDAVPIPRATNPTHIRENAQVFDFSITGEDMNTLNSLNENLHLSWDPTNLP